MTAVMIAVAPATTPALSYCIVDTGQTHCFSDQGQLFRLPRPGTPFFGQDGYFQGPQPSYRDNGDGTVTDRNTDLMWQKTPELQRRMTFAEARDYAAAAKVAGHRDWRLPSIKELYSLVNFSGNCLTQPPRPYLDAQFFEMRFGDEARGERLIDGQFWSSTEYVGLTMRGDPTVFGVNFADGRIKGYPRDTLPGGRKVSHFVRLVRGNRDYGKNQFRDNRDGTISDLATGLMWGQADSGQPLDWEQALAYGVNLRLAGYKDWRLPNAKELQSIVDYTRAPDAQSAARRGPAIDPLFQVSHPEAWYWSSTTHLEAGRVQGSFAVYVAFGRATGYMPTPDGQRRYMNVHGAGAQRSDPKSGDPQSPLWARGLGPQGDEVRIANYARAVRNIDPASVRLVEPDVTPVPVGVRPSPGKGPLSKPGKPPR